MNESNSKHKEPLLLKKSESQLTNNIPVRYTVPGRFDRAPFNSLCLVIKDDHDTEPLIFIQIKKEVSHNSLSSSLPQESSWVDLGVLLLGAMGSTILDPDQRLIFIENYYNNISLNKNSLSWDIDSHKTVSQNSPLSMHTTTSL